MIWRSVILCLFFVLKGEFESYADDERLPRVIMDEENPKRLKEAEKIVREMEGHFKRIFKKDVRTPFIEIQMTKPLQKGNVKCTYEGHVEGLTLFTNTGCIIQIAKDRSATWGRVLAHEMGHVLIHEAYGTPVNQWLSEGMSEYLAGESFPSEVRVAHRKNLGQKFLIENIVPYVEGLTFCNSHAEHALFPKFFEMESKNSVSSLRELEARWKQFILKEKPTNPKK